MSWTEPYDGSKLLNNPEGLCMAYSLEACIIAAKKGIAYDVEPDTYVEKYFCGVQPTGPEFLAFLNNLGFDTKAIHEKVLSTTQEISEMKSSASEKAATFFDLFQTEWHVQNEDVAKYIDENSVYFLIELAVQDAASTRARLNAIRRHSEDPRQHEKSLVRECWDEWQKQPTRYVGKAAFARDMLDKFQNLKSQPVIEGWCRTWERETSVSAQGTQSAS